MEAHLYALPFTGKWKKNSQHHLLVKNGWKPSSPHWKESFLYQYLTGWRDCIYSESSMENLFPWRAPSQISQLSKSTCGYSYIFSDNAKTSVGIYVFWARVNSLHGCGTELVLLNRESHSVTSVTTRPSLPTLYTNLYSLPPLPSYSPLPYQTLL